MTLRAPLIALLCLAMLLQNAMALGLAAYSMQQAKAFVSGYVGGEMSNDIELICTGKTMRYISVSATELAGEFVFVPLDDLQGHAESIDCTNGTLADVPQIDDVFSQQSIKTSFVRYYALAMRIAQQPYTAFAYAAPHGRAPPLFITSI